MAIISVIIVESEDQIVSGIPRTITLSTNTPATILYTLDGTDPTILSEIYVEPIELPTDLLKVELRIFATDGILSSPILSEIYQTNILENARLPHSATTAEAGSTSEMLYPFGDNPYPPTSTFLSPGEAGLTVNDPTKTQIASGYDGNGNENAFTNNPYNIEYYNIVYPNVGNLPAGVTIDIPEEPPEESYQFDKLFDPRAFVIIQDYTQLNIDDPMPINRSYMNLEDPDTTRDGNYFFSCGLDSPTVTGSFLKSYYNPKDNTITYYYYDSHANKWIISKTTYTNTSLTSNLTSMVLGRNQGVGKVFEWLPFTRRVLF
jgi:hypothetical protein